MKNKRFYKFIISLAAVVTLSLSTVSCTKNQSAKKFGGTTSIQLPAGQKLVDVTWKDDNLWYLTEPMEEGYEPKTKTFKENSSWGVMEGTVIFRESK